MPGLGLRLALAAFVATACTGAPPAERAPVKVDFKEVQGQWALAGGGEETQVGLVLGEHRLEFGSVPGICKPTAELPFTEVEGQKSLAALSCQSPDGGHHHVVLVEVMGDDPSWPAPVGVAIVLTRPSEDGKIALVTMGMQDLPLGVTPLAPPTPSEPAPDAPSEGATESGDTDG